MKVYILYRSSVKARKQWIYGFVVFVRAREMRWTPGRCQGFKYTVERVREKCCTCWRRCNIKAIVHS